MMTKHIATILGALMTCGVLNAASVDADVITDSIGVVVDTIAVKQHAVTDSNYVVPDLKWEGAGAAWKRDFTYGCVPLLVTGLALHIQQDDYRELRNKFVPKFNSLLDNYSQFSPLVVTTAIKAFGGETRSNWGRYTVSSAFSAALMAGFVNSLKYTVKEMRPDGTTRNSFPSGHTATAFMCATIMSKELGWRSPWYSVGAYGVAATTGIFRVLNNRHWINDVVFGAGIGILSVDLGYFLGDLVFKEKGINPRSLVIHTPDLDGKPSFLSVGMSVGTTINLNAPQIYDRYVSDENLVPASDAVPLNLHLRTGATTSVGVEGAYFFNRRWGIGGQADITAVPVTPEYNPEFQPYAFANIDIGGDVPQSVSAYKLDGLEASTLGIINIGIGPYWSGQIGKRWRLGAKLLLGTSINTNFEINGYSSANAELRQALEDMVNENLLSREDYDDLVKTTKDTDFLHIETSPSFSATTGVSLTYAVRSHSAIRLYVDYAFSNPKYTYKLYNRMDWRAIGDADSDEDPFIEDRFEKRTTISQFKFGMSFTTLF